MEEPKSPVIHTPNTKKNNPPPKILSGFLYKAVLFAVFVALLPLFPPQISDSANHTLLSRTWELLYLLVVGIAVSYGLFSRINAETDLDRDKDKENKADTPHSVLSRILQVPSVFDDEADMDAMAAGDRKAETWSSQYQPTNPVVFERKPLLLPVRSLKNSRVQVSDSSRSSNNESKQSVVLPSPIPWRTRSGRMEVGDEGSPVATASASRTPSCSAKAHTFPTAEMWAKTSQDSIRDKSFSVAAPPRAPPPPPRPPNHSSLRREVNKSFKDELKDMSRKGREGFLRSSYLDAEPLESEFPSRRSVRTTRSKEAQSVGTSHVQSVEKAPILQQRKYRTEKKKRVAFLEKMIVVSDDSGSEEGSNSSDDEEVLNVSAAAGAAAEENEVDKKADEFIAKFREQIRLQRIESIKKSSGHKAARKIM